MNQNIFTMVIEGALGGGLTIISYFLKRTISELDSCKKDISEVKENYVDRNELMECQKDIARVKADYITREDFFREQDNTRRQLDRIMSVLLEIKGESKQ